MENEKKLEELRELFKGDRFATNAGCTIREASLERVVCEMPITHEHLNLRGGVMGGAIFTLADFAFAVMSNYSGIPSVSVESNLCFYSSAKGSRLIASCTPDKEGRRLGYYTIDIKDDLGTPVAGCTAIAFHTTK